jgi:putative salt-induced outer membrane protein YdiY
LSLAGDRCSPGLAAISLALVVGLALSSAARAETIELETGDKLEGVEILEKGEEVWSVEHPVLGRIEIPVDQIKPPDPVKPGLFGTRFMRGWSRSISAGFSGSSGVTKENNINADAEFANETERHRDQFVARYYYSDADSSRTNNEFDATHIHDFLFKDTPWFTFLGGGYRYDEFQGWDHRIGGSGGVGYEFVTTERFSLIGRAGPGFTVTRGGNKDQEREDFNGLALVRFDWTVFEGSTVTGSTSYVPVFNDLPEFRSLSRLEWKIALGVIDGLGFKIGGSYEYDSQNEGTNNDRKYYGNLVYDF